MADILYVYGGTPYVNLTNKCCCQCTFCIRKNGDGLGSAENLWHKTQPDWETIRQAFDHFDFTGCKELVFCGYGEPTYALDNLLLAAEYMKEHFPDICLRVNTNGLGSLINGKDIVPLLAKHIDCLSISLNAPTKERYDAISRPAFPDAFQAMLDFAAKARTLIPQVKFTVVDVISPEEIASCKALADRMQIPLRVRTYSA